MKYTFSALVQLSYRETEQLDYCRREWSGRIIEPVLIAGQPSSFYRITREHSYFPDEGEWCGFYSGPSSVQQVCDPDRIMEMGICCSPARFVFSGNRLPVGRSVNIFTDENLGPYWYDIRAGVANVLPESVGAFLTKDLNRLRGVKSRQISFEQWRSFHLKMRDIDKLLRAVRKLDQLRGTRKNGGAFERLSAEVTELICSTV